MKYKNQNHFLFKDVIPILTISLFFIMTTLCLIYNLSCIQSNEYTFQDSCLLYSGGPYTPISPIFIDNSDPNYNWNKTSYENDWCSGQGTAENPYVIKNIVINAQDSGSCIVIRDSSVIFRIENCLLLNSSTGSVLNFKAGIKLENVKNGVIINNEISNNNGIGLFGFNSDNNDISGNTINNNKNGIWMLSCKSNNFTGNTISNQLEDGINFILCDFNKISGNSINDNKNGIILYISDNNTISENSLIGNDVFIYEELCKDNIIQDNIYWEEVPDEEDEVPDEDDEIPDDEDEIPFIPPQDYTLLLLIAAAVGVAGGLSVGIVVQRRRTALPVGIPPKKGLKGKQELVPPIVDAKEYQPDMTRINLNGEETVKRIKEEDSFLTREAIEQLRQKEKRYEAVKELKKEKLHDILNENGKAAHNLTIIEPPEKTLKRKGISENRFTKKGDIGKK